jgi:hypothetical protein
MESGDDVVGQFQQTVTEYREAMTANVRLNRIFHPHACSLAIYDQFTIR